MCYRQGDKNHIESSSQVNFSSCCACLLSGWLWPPYIIGPAIIFLPCGFYLLSVFCLFSSPNLSRRWLDVCHTSAHGVALVRIWDAGLKRATLGSLKYRRQKIAKNSPSVHHCTTLSGYIFAIKARIDNRKNLLSSNISSTCPAIWWTSAR